MSEKISDYVADATSNPIKNEDYLDFSNEDGIGGYDVSKKILVSEFLAFIPTVKIGKSLFVSSEGVTIADGALRESLTKHFLTMAEAKSVALAGDTIYVYGDQTPNTNLYKDDVIWEFMGNPTITNNQTLFNDGGVAGKCVIRGNASFVASTIAFNFSGVGSILNLECESVLSTSSPTLQLIDTIANIKANGNLHTNTGATFYISGVSDIKVTARTITSGNLCLNVSGSGVSGTIIINADYISSTSGGNGSVLYASNSGTEVDVDIIINVTDRIFHAGAVNTCMAVRPDSGRWVINGNIDGGVGVAIKDFTPTTGRVFTHNGNATNDGQNPVVFLTDNADTDCVTYLNGTYTGSNANTIYQDNTLNTLFINGRIENTNALAVAKSGVFINVGTATLFKNVIIIMDLDLGTPTCIDATTPITAFKVLHSLGTNSGASANVSNLIAGAIFNVDLDYE